MDYPTIDVLPFPKKTVNKTLKKLDKVVKKLKKDGWETSDDVTFHHPLAPSGEAIRARLWNIDVLVTNKCRITINAIDNQNTA